MTDDINVRPTTEQIIELSALEREHGGLVRIDRHTRLGAALMQGELDSSIPYFCRECGSFYLIEVDGETHIYVLKRIVRVQ